MPDALYTDSRVQTTFPDEYMRLLNPVCGGHALWSPRRSSSGGGALGDVGTIVNGAFYKEFNLFDGPMSHHAEDVSRGEPYSKSFMSSSRDSRIEFHIMGTTNIAPLPLETLAVRPQITLHEGKDGLAFLAPPMPTHWDTIHPTARTTVANWLAQQVQSDPVGFENRVVVTEVIRSSGYIGGLMLSQRREMSSSLTLDGPISASVGGSAGQHRSLCSERRAPRATRLDARKSGRISPYLDVLSCDHAAVVACAGKSKDRLGRLAHNPGRIRPFREPE
ncbi:hypothetical protein EXIGLDRAFT_172550 [Exidia glandulosa HHB12029]|uniref:Uncharacterized protein n=1 Tax=Exidia glandulosa HHB12029 TaxID=1314781 RepID=A0A165FAD3_EXIGL|nr:hypothetical protein EXIGLDRAFT_172550 [Exidia glandulosa HHB12029]